MHLYEQAIRSTHENGFVHNEAVAYETAGRFYIAQSFDKIADVYLREARYGYLRWGADGRPASVIDFCRPILSYGYP